MTLSPELVRAIESTHVAFEGLSHPLRCVNAEIDPSQPGSTRTVTVTVEATHDGHARRAACRFAEAQLQDERYVATTLAKTIRQVFAGELNAGAVRGPA